ncbi:MAG: response regulator [Planctomycetaceae bacterium]|nr:response regulator [Planctomycetaceae bacterium]
MSHKDTLICFVEDSDIDFEMAVLAIRRVCPDAEVRRATTFHDAVRTLTDEDLTLIVLDINLPDGNGIDVLRRLRRIGMSEDVAIVVFSTSANPVEQDEAIAAGANEFVTKPTNSEEYLTRVSQFVSRWT